MRMIIACKHLGDSQVIDEADMDLRKLISKAKNLR